jgi:hypothetical protein
MYHYLFVQEVTAYYSEQITTAAVPSFFIKGWGALNDLVD